MSCGNNCATCACPIEPVTASLLATPEAQLKDILNALGVQGHQGAIAEIKSLRQAAGVDPAAPSEFQKELVTIINRHNQENGSDTPDFILAEYLTHCLAAFNKTTQVREIWYGRESKPIGLEVTPTSGSGAYIMGSSSQTSGIADPGTVTYFLDVADNPNIGANAAQCPLPLSVIPNYMGINLCSVRQVSWRRQTDNQLLWLTISFNPAKPEVQHHFV